MGRIQMRRWSVSRDGFLVGRVEADTEYAAQVEAEAKYGPGSKALAELMQNESEESINDRMALRSLISIPQYHYTAIYHTGRVETIPAVVDKWLMVNVGIQVVAIEAPICMKQGIADPDDIDQSLLDDPLLDPNRDEWVVYVTWYRLIQMPTIRTIDEIAGEVMHTPEEMEFFSRLQSEFQSNATLFKWASEEVMVDWVHSKHPETERHNCVQAVRRHFGWI